MSTLETDDSMKIRCVWEHNGNDSLIYAENLAGAFTRGETREIALGKMEDEVKSFFRWKGEALPENLEIVVAQEWASGLDICDADSDVIFDEEKSILTQGEYLYLKELALKSARDFYALYSAVPDKHASVIPNKITFLGPRPRTAHEMYEHTKSVNSYYFGEIGVEVDSEGTIFECRERGFSLLEKQEDFLRNEVVIGSYDEAWSLRKVLRRFLWHDRIHAKAMYRMAVKTFGEGIVPDVFRFTV